MSRNWLQPGPEDDDAPVAAGRARRPAATRAASGAPLTIVTWKWKPPPGYRSTFTARHVNVLASMVGRNYAGAHEVVCVTDDPAGLDPAIRPIPLWDDHAQLKSPHGARNPSCYRRLKMFSSEAAQLFGPRFVSLDLDCVITGDLAPIFDRPVDFAAWGDTAKGTFYNGSLILMAAGARTRVWDDFKPRLSPTLALRAGQFGSDQAWISYRLGPRESKFGQDDGVHSYRNHIKPAGGGLPPGARIVFFHGAVDPWTPEAQRLPWVREHWR